MAETSPVNKPSRLPAPTLFVGPPSRNASQRSLARLPDTGSKLGRDLPKSGLSRSLTRDNEPSNPLNSSSDSNHNAERPKLPTATKPSDRTIDSKYRSMQNALNEVELTAQSTTHVFGTAHAAALDSLRHAQVNLARAWGRGNEDQAVAAAPGSASSAIGGARIEGDETEGLDASGAVKDGVRTDRFKGAADLVQDRTSVTMENTRPRRSTASSASTNLSDEDHFSDGRSAVPPGSAGGDASSRRRAGSGMEDDTAADIRRASERRAANEAYFRQVDRGVREVVEKLEKVAEAMRGVEAESRSLWSERSSEVEGGDGDPKE